MELRNRKRAERRARTRRIVNQQRVILNRIGMVEEWPSFYAHNAVWYRPISKQETGKWVGLTRKKKALDCGKTGCYCCGCRKMDGNKRLRTRREELSDIEFREQVLELIAYKPTLGHS